MNNLERKFNKFDAENVHVWLLFLQFADQVRLTGRLVYSVNAIFERMRCHPNRAGFFRTKLVRGE